MSEVWTSGTYPSSIPIPKGQTQLPGKVHRCRGQNLGGLTLPASCSSAGRSLKVRTLGLCLPANSLQAAAEVIVSASSSCECWVYRGRNTNSAHSASQEGKAAWPCQSHWLCKYQDWRWMEQSWLELLKRGGASLPTLLSASRSCGCVLKAGRWAGKEEWWGLLRILPHHELCV